MRWLIRRLQRRGKGQVAYEDDVHYGDVLTIGRGADQAIFLTDLRAALQHAKITVASRGKYRVDSLILAGLRVNGGIVQAATLGAGDVIEIGSTRIELVEPPADFEGAVEVSTIERAEQEASARSRARPTSLQETWLQKRWPSLGLFALILLLFLVLPIGAHYSTSLDGFLRASPLPSRGAWEAGELAPAHHFFGEDCGTCHGSQPFAVVRDATCLTCHATIAAHADPVVFDLPQLGEARCAHCHRDHNGRFGLVREDQALCADCHSGLAEKHAALAGAPAAAGEPGAAGERPDAVIANVTDFGDDHPEFRVTLTEWSASRGSSVRRVALNTSDAVERSGLKFPHDTHLDPAGIRGPDGDRVLVCASCHQPDRGAATMQPVDFETMCQDCHRLTFDVTEPQRQVPHAKIEEILYMLDEFYARRALEGEIKDPTAPETVRTRRRPGQPVTREIRQEALTWARDKARRTGESLFTGTACSNCHAVTPGRVADEPWMVAPVRVAGIWFPKAHFDHGSHTTMACADCHAAEQSDTSQDLLLPDIASCRTCHAGESGASNRLSSSCTACHGYHESGELLLRDL